MSLCAWQGTWHAGGATVQRNSAAEAVTKLKKTQGTRHAGAAHERDQAGSIDAVVRLQEALEGLEDLD
eukprot:scaffold86900_cov20-Tisochrysis_lutea.AAC.4